MGAPTTWKNLDGGAEELLIHGHDVRRANGPGASPSSLFPLPRPLPRPFIASAIGWLEIPHFSQKVIGVHPKMIRVAVASSLLQITHLPANSTALALHPKNHLIEMIGSHRKLFEPMSAVSKHIKETAQCQAVRAAKARLSGQKGKKTLLFPGNGKRLNSKDRLPRTKLR